ncbi:MAG: PEP-CTERM sorting domain-containing protein [Burkholderiales bacterium]|nr:MAG: PEP-CTERM sorting domain-containing protein [Burkholderiales bacterium]
MKSFALAALLLATLGAAQAHETDYTITTTWLEPQTQPKNSIFQGSFTYDEDTHTVTGLKGLLSESMTGTSAGTMTWLPLNYQLQSWYDATLGGTFAAVFKNSTTATFCSTALCGGPADNWSPQTGVNVGGIYAGFPKASSNPGNAYALIFVPDTPTALLSQAQISKLAYADCAPGGMMGAVCMTGTSLAGYGATGTMDGYPLSQTIAAAVPEPGSYALMLAGLGLIGSVARRRSRRA